MSDDNVTDFEARRRAAIEEPRPDDGVERLHLSISMPEPQEIKVAVDLRHLELLQALALGMVGGILGGGLLIVLMT